MNSREQKLLEEFFKNSKKWLPNQYIYTYGAAFFCFISVILACFPILRTGMTSMEQLDKIMILYMFAFEWVALNLLMKKYEVYDADKRRGQINRVLDFLPLTRKQVVLFQFKMTVKYALRLTAILLVPQIGCSIAFALNFAVINVLIVIAGAFIIPVGINALIYVYAK